jgi:hypothetical protein
MKEATLKGNMMYSKWQSYKGTKNISGCQEIGDWGEDDPRRSSEDT